MVHTVGDRLHPREATGADGGRASGGGASRPADGGDAAADDEAGDGGADDDLLAVARDLLAPVGDLGDLAAQPVERQRELGAVGLDRARGSPRACAAASRSSSPDRGLHRLADQLGLLDRHPGVGGAPLLNSARRGTRRAPPRMNRTPATKKKPQKNVRVATGSTHQASHARPCSRNSRPAIDEDAGGDADRRALRELVSFSVTSALASSISSRTRSWALLGDLVDGGDDGRL